MGNQSSAYARYIKENHQSQAIAQFSMEVVSQVFHKHKHMRMTNRFGELPTYEWNFDEQAIMDDVCKAFVAKFGGSWTCLAGPNASYGIHPRPSNFIRFDIDDTGVGDMLNSQKSFCRIIIFQN